MTLLSPDDVAPVKRDLDATLAALDRMLLGRPELHRLVLAGILARGHILLEGLPGLGKTALIRALAQILDLDFKRVQFTPDLMPSDILGSHILETGPDGNRWCSSRVRCSATSFLRTKSTAPRRRRNPPCSRRCRSVPSR